MTREENEVKSLFKDARFAREAWRSLGTAVLSLPPCKVPEQYDKNGDKTFETLAGEYSYAQLAADCKRAGREPTMLEYILRCQAVNACFNTSAFVALRDTVGAKPIDESKTEATVVNQYETLSDEELELLAQHRAAQRAADREATIAAADAAAQQQMPERTCAPDAEQSVLEYSDATANAAAAPSAPGASHHLVDEVAAAPHTTQEDDTNE